MRKSKNNLSFLPCLVCGVDSGPVLGFFAWLVGGVILATVLILFWAISKGKLKKKNLAMQPIDIEGASND